MTVAERQIATTSKASSEIPVVDFSRWTQDGSYEDRMTVAKQLISACRQVGFVYIINHGVDRDLLAEAFGWSKKLFDLKHEEKMMAPHPDGPWVHRGYSYPGLEKVSQETAMDSSKEDDEKIHQKLRQVSDCKESYEIGSEHNPDEPNIWLPEDILPGFRNFTTKFYWECFEAARRILRAMAMGLGLADENYFLRYHTGINSQLRLLHYPSIPAKELETESLARMPAHSDWSSLTMLFQDDCGGLEVEDPHKKGTFMAAQPLENSLIMNVGDCLMRWSNDFLKSTLHRVTLPPFETSFTGPDRITRERYSIPYFVTPDPDTMIECLPTCVDAQRPAKYEPIRDRDYRRMRAAYQYEPKPSAPTTRAEVTGEA
ncbi:MAG: hypothetical protein M1833_005678 [Piccolia ochrophora]|nr:MAG: hypothetical protein M1833_005678 [Piccolia ochrophora]